MKKIYDYLLHNSQVIFIAATALFLFPFLVLSFFNHPASDDFCYTNFIQDHDFWEAQVKHYFVWTGRFTATFLLTIDPIDIDNLTLYRVLPIFLLLSTGMAVYLLVKSLVPNLSRLNQFILSGLIFFLYLYYAPNTAEAFYWRAGSVTYQLAIVLSLLLFAVIRKVQQQRSSSMTSLYTLLACLLTVICIGLNETTMVINLVIISLWVIGWFIFRKSTRLEMGLILFFTLVATGIVVFAPGNAVRMAEKPDKFQFVFSIVGALKITLMSILRWTPMTVLVLVLFSPLLNRTATSLRGQFNTSWIRLWHLVTFGIFLFGFLVLCFFPSFWSQGGRPPFRTINVIYLLFIIGVFFLTSMFLVYLQEKNAPLPKLKVGDFWALILISLGLILFKPNNIAEAYADLFSGRAYKYHLEMQDRYRILKNCPQDKCVVPSLKYQPVTILSSDITSDPSREIYYYNRCLASFFSISEVIGLKKKVP